MNQVHHNPTVRHDAVILFDVTDGNPNGDPDLDNQPRIDDETNQGIVTDVALKRKIRDTIPLLTEETGYGIFVQAGHALNTRIAEATQETQNDATLARNWLCQQYFDIRMFGAVLSTGEKLEGSKSAGVGQVYGPTQLTFARSIDPIAPVEHTITRLTSTTQKDLDSGKTSTMGRKWTVPYGLYRAHLHFSGPKAIKTGVTEHDMQKLWTSIENMFEHDRSSSRGDMKTCGLYIFSHTTAFGNAPAHQLTKRITTELTDPTKPPRSHTDYTVTINEDTLPDGVQLTKQSDLWT